MAQKLLTRFLRNLSGGRTKRKRKTPTYEEDKTLAKLWNRVRKRVLVPNFALDNMKSLYEWASKLEEKMEKSKSPEERESAKYFRAIKKRAFSEKFFTGSVKVIGYREKVFVKTYKKRIRKIEKKFGKTPKTKIMKVKGYVKQRPKRWSLSERLQIAKLYVSGLKPKEIVNKVVLRTYSSITTELSRLKKRYGDLNKFIREVEKTRKDIKNALRK